jgi:hypothetical protein
MVKTAIRLTTRGVRGGRGARFMPGSLDHASPGHHTTLTLLKIRVTLHPGEPSELRRGRERCDWRVPLPESATNPS